MHTDDLSSDDEAAGNTVFNVPREWYADYDHVGYDLAGQRIAKPARTDGIDRFLASQDDPRFKWTILDDETGEEITLSKRDVQLIQRMRAGTVAHPEANMYPNTVEIYTDTVEPHPLNDPNEPKRRFLPSKWEQQRIYRIVRAIKEGRMARQEERKPDRASSYLLWDENDAAIGYEERKKAPPAIPAPKTAPPGHAASYNPPPEYLLTAEEEAAWHAADPSDRPLDFIPRKFSALRQVPLYAAGVRERFERCLDLYLCPRLTRSRSEVDPETLLPKLPDPAALRPFPTSTAFTFDGHTGRVRSLSVDPSGAYLASGSDDGTVRLWHVASGRCERSWAIGGPVRSVAWCPNPVVHVIAAITGSSLLFLYSGTCVTAASAQATADALNGARGGASGAPEAGDASDAPKRSRRTVSSSNGDGDGDDSGSSDGEKEGGGGGGDSSSDDEGGTRASASTSCEWKAEGGALNAHDLLPRTLLQQPQEASHTGIRLRVEHPGGSLSLVVWHHGGDYVATVAPQASAGSTPPVFVHQLTRHASTSPFRSSGGAGAVQSVAFHPHKPLFYVASQRSVRVYDLVKEALLLKLEAGVQWISSMAIHPSGDHVLLGSYDHRVVWFDTELSSKPYRTLKYHAKAVRKACFHAGPWPLMATASDDGTVHVFHARVFNDFAQNPLIVPVKILRAHAVTGDGLGCLDVVFHPTQPWLFTAGADGVIKLWHDVP